MLATRHVIGLLACTEPQRSGSRVPSVFATLPRQLARAGDVSFEGGKFGEGPHKTAGFSEGMPRLSSSLPP